MNSIKQLAIMVNAVEKLTHLPASEITNQPRMVEEIKSVFSAQNVNGILNSIVNEMNEERNIQRMTQSSAPDYNQLLFSYAQKETDRLKGAPGKVYTTKIVNAGDEKELKDKGTAKNAKASPSDAEKKFATVFNSIYSTGAVKINVDGDPTTLNSYIDYTPYRVNFAEYLSVPTLSEMVDRPLAIALKKFPLIKSESKEFNKAILKFIDRKKIRSVIKDALFYAALSPRGSLVVPIQRGKTVTFNAFNDTQFAYGIGSSYSGVTQPYVETKVGDLYCLGAKLRHGVSAFFTCPGYEPLFGVGLNRIPQLRTAAESWNLYIHILKYLLVRAQVIVQKMDGDVQTDTMLGKMMAQLESLAQNMGVGTTVEQTRGQTLDILNNNISPGTADIAPVLQSFVSSVTGVAPEYFFGGGQAAYSQAAFQIHSTNENIRSRYQISEIEPLLRFIINTAIRYDDNIAALGVDEDDFDIEFPNIYDETAQEKAELEGKRTETLIRQAGYPELEEAFKKEGLLHEDIKLVAVEPEGGEPEGGEPEGGGGSSNVLTKPLS